MGLVSKDIAKNEVLNWLSYQQVTQEQIELQSAAVAKMVSGVELGVLVIDETTNEIIQKLNFPVGNEAKLTTLDFKATITTGEIQLESDNIEKIPGSNNLHAWCAALTGTQLSTITKMNQKDWAYSSAIVIFFMM